MTRSCTTTISAEINGSASATRAMCEQSPGALTRAHLDACSKPGPIAFAARKTAYAAKLTTGGIEGAFVLLVQTDAGLGRKKSGDAIQKTSTKSGASLDEEAAKKALVKAINTIQARARQKYFFTEPAALTAYYIGTDRIDANRAILEQVSQAIIDKLVTDTLPGVTTAQKTALAEFRQDYIDTNLEQGGVQSGATDDRIALPTMLKSITQRRMTIQFAADAEWPSHDPDSAGIREEFHLPPGRAVHRLKNIGHRKFTYALSIRFAYLTCYIISLLLLEASTSHAQAIEVQGWVKYWRNGANQTTNLAAFKHFTATGSQEKWKITTVNDEMFRDSETNSAISSVSVSSDGKDIITETQLDLIKLKSITLAKSKSKPPLGVEALTNMVVVKAGNIPYMDPSFTAAIWFSQFSGFFSNWNFKPTSTVFYSMNEASARRLSTMIAVERSAECPELVSSLRFYNLGKFQYIGPNNAIVEKQMKPPYDREFTECIYHVIASEKNSNGQCQVTAFRFDYFKGKQGAASSSDQELYAYIEGRVGRVSTSPKVASTPKDLVTARTYVIDLRDTNQSKRQLTYITTNRVYNAGDTNYKQIQANIAKKESILIRQTGTTSNNQKRLIIAITFAMVTGAFWFLIWRAKANKH